MASERRTERIPGRIGTVEARLRQDPPRIAEDAIQGPAFLEGPCRDLCPAAEPGIAWNILGTILDRCSRKGLDQVCGSY